MEDFIFSSEKLFFFLKLIKKKKMSMSLPGISKDPQVMKVMMYT